MFCYFKWRRERERERERGGSRWEPRTIDAENTRLRLPRGGEHFRHTQGKGAAPGNKNKKYAHLPRSKLRRIASSIERSPPMRDGPNLEDRPRNSRITSRARVCPPDPCYHQCRSSSTCRLPPAAAAAWRRRRKYCRRTLRRPWYYHRERKNSVAWWFIRLFAPMERAGETSGPAQILMRVSTRSYTGNFVGDFRPVVGKSPVTRKTQLFKSQRAIILPSLPV